MCTILPKDGEKTVKKEPPSLIFRFTLFFVFFIIAVYSIVIITSLQQLVGITETIGFELGNPILKETAAIIDGDSFEALSTSLDPGDPWYEETRRAMLAIKEQTDCIYLYTMAPAEGTVFRYIIDGSAPPEDEDAFSPLGAEEDIASYSGAVFAALEKKTAQISNLDFRTQWGWVVSVYSPILNSGGKAVGVIGCDFKAEQIYERLWSQIRRQLILSAVFIAAGFIAYLYLVNGVNRQNQRLRELKNTAVAASRLLKDERDTITAMKDALKVGLFFMDKNFVIQKHYSKFLETLLGIRDLGGKKFTDLIAPSVSQGIITSMIEYFVLLFNRAKAADRRMSEKMLEDLNPVQELAYVNSATGERMILRCNFVSVDRGGGRLFVLGNLQDITNEKKLQKRLEELDSGKKLPIR